MSQPEKFCSTREALAEATGHTLWMLKAIAAESKGKADCPFRGRGAYPSAIKAWLKPRPGFRAVQALPRRRATPDSTQTATPPSPRSGPPASTAGRFDAPATMSGSQTPGPLALAHHS